LTFLTETFGFFVKKARYRNVIEPLCISRVRFGAHLVWKNFGRKAESFHFYFCEHSHVEFRPRSCAQSRVEFGQKAGVVAVLLAHAEISSDPYMPPFPARTSYALLPLCPSPESPCPEPPAPEHYIIRKPTISSHHPAIFSCRERGAKRFHTRSKRPTTPRRNT
jgi:hypothetical protein